MAQIFTEDFCALKTDPILAGHITHTWHDVYPEPVDIESGFFMHNLPEHFRDRFEETRLIPKGYVIFLITRPVYLQLLVAEDELVVIDRYFSRGDVVKRNPQDAQSGTVIGSSAVCMLSPSFAITENSRGSSRTIDCIALDGAAVLNVDVQDLMPLHSGTEGDTIIYNNWLGTIRGAQEQVTIKLDGGIVVIDDAAEIEEVARSPSQDDVNNTRRRRGHQRDDDSQTLIPAEPCYYGQRVRIPRDILSSGHWIRGSYRRRMKSDGDVIGVACKDIEIDWKMPKQGHSTDAAVDVSTSPKRYIAVDELKSGGATIYHSDTGAPYLTTNPPFVSAGENVRFKDMKVAESKYGLRVADYQPRKIASLPSTWKAPIRNAIMAQIISTTSKVTVRWQDNSVTEEPASSVAPYEEVDDHDVWPGELVSRKDQEDSHHDPAYEKLLRVRELGVVQSVNADERVALVRWFEGADITITGEDHDQLVKSLSTFGQISDKITEVSVFEVEGYHAIVRRRGDMVCIRPPAAPRPGTFRDVVRYITSNEPTQGDGEWYGEVVDLLLDGQVLVRLGGLKDIRDVPYSVLDITVAVSADDDTTDESISEAFDTDDFDDEEEDDGPALYRPAHAATPRTTIEYEGSAPPISGSNGEDQWMTDSDSGEESRKGSPSPQRLRNRKISASKEKDTQATESTGEVTGPPISSRPSGEDLKAAAEADVPRSANSGPVPFDVLEEPSPQHSFGAQTAARSGKWLKAVLREHQILRSSLPDSVYVRTWESSMELIRVLIVGPAGTPYALAPFLFDIHLGPQFPYQAPSAFFHSWTNGIGRVNPNLYEDGKVCLSLLGTWYSEKDDEEWVPFKSSILQVIVSLLGLVLVKEPFYNEAGYEALQGTVKSKHPSSLYSEKAFVLSRRFVAHAIETWPAGFGDIVKWLYMPSLDGPSILRTVIDDCKCLLQGEGVVQASVQQQLDKYYITSSKLSQGVLILLKKILPSLEALLVEQDSIEEDSMDVD